MLEINLEIPDQNIDTEGVSGFRSHQCVSKFFFYLLTVVFVCAALQVVFGSLYRDDVLIKPSRVISVLAAACMLQLDGLIQQCAETMKENISAKTVCGYYASASIYGLDSVMKKSELHLYNSSIVRSALYFKVMNVHDLFGPLQLPLSGVTTGF